MKHFLASFLILINISVSARWALGQNYSQDEEPLILIPDYRRDFNRPSYTKESAKKLLESNECRYVLIEDTIYPVDPSLFSFESHGNLKEYGQHSYYFSYCQNGEIFFNKIPNILIQEGIITDISVGYSYRFPLTQGLKIIPSYAYLIFLVNGNEIIEVNVGSSWPINEFEKRTEQLSAKEILIELEIIKDDIAEIMKEIESTSQDCSHRCSSIKLKKDYEAIDYFGISNPFLYELLMPCDIASELIDNILHKAAKSNDTIKGWTMTYGPLDITGINVSEQTRESFEKSLKLIW